MTSTSSKEASRQRRIARATSPPIPFENPWVKRIWPFYARARHAPNDERKRIVKDAATTLVFAANTAHRQIAALLFMEAIDYDASLAPRGLSLLAIETIAKFWKLDPATGAKLMAQAWAREITVTRLVELYSTEHPGARQGGYQKESDALSSLYRKVDTKRPIRMPDNTFEPTPHPPANAGAPTIPATRLVRDLARHLDGRESGKVTVLVSNNSAKDAQVPLPSHVTLISEVCSVSAIASNVVSDADGQVFAAELACSMLQSRHVIGCYSASTDYLRSFLTRLYAGTADGFEAREGVVTGLEVLEYLNGASFPSPALLIEAMDTALRQTA